MVIHGLEFPDSCPENCRLGDEGKICKYCPIYMCIITHDNKGNKFKICEPFELRKDWVIEWHMYFTIGQIPTLML